MALNDYLQYGAMGLLSLLIVIVGGWVTWYSKEQQKFIRELVNQAITSQRNQTEEWRRMLQSNIDAQVSVAAALADIARTIADTAGDAEEQRQRLRENHERIVRACDKAG
jgi:hypothetical protein